MKALIEGKRARELRVCAELFDEILMGRRRFDIRLKSDAPREMGEVVLFVRESSLADGEAKVGCLKRVTNVIDGSEAGVVDARFCIFGFEDLDGPEPLNFRRHLAQQFSKG